MRSARDEEMQEHGLKAAGDGEVTGVFPPEHVGRGIRRLRENTSDCFSGTVQSVMAYPDVCVPPIPFGANVPPV